MTVHSPGLIIWTFIDLTIYLRASLFFVTFGVCKNTHYSRMFQVKWEKIMNDQVRKRFYDIPCVENMIAARLLSFIGKAVRDPNPLRPTKLMLTTCCNNSRKRGRPYTTNKDTIVNCLVLLFERVPEVEL